MKYFKLALNPSNTELYYTSIDIDTCFKKLFSDVETNIILKQDKKILFDIIRLNNELSELAVLMEIEVDSFGIDPDNIYLRYRQSELGKYGIDCLKLYALTVDYQFDDFCYSEKGTSLYINDFRIFHGEIELEIFFTFENNNVVKYINLDKFKEIADVY